MDHDMRKKGQVMIMMALVIVIIITAIRIEFNNVSEIERIEFESSRILPEKLVNVREGIRDSARMSFRENPEDEHMRNQMATFIRFVREREDLRVFYVVSHYNPNTDDLDVRVSNFLTEDLDSVKVEDNITGSQTTNNLGTIGIGGDAESTTTHDVAENTLVEINVSYTTGSTREDHRVSYFTKADPGFNTTSLYIDTRLAAGDSLLTDKRTDHYSYNTTSGEGGEISLPGIEPPAVCDKCEPEGIA